MSNSLYNILYQQSPEDLERERMAREAGGAQAQLAEMQEQGWPTAPSNPDEGYYGPDQLIAEGQRQLEQQKTTDKYKREDELRSADQERELELTRTADAGRRGAYTALGIDVPQGLAGEGIDLFGKQKLAEMKAERDAEAPMTEYQKAVVAGQDYTRKKIAKGATAKVMDAALQSAQRGVSRDAGTSKDMESYNAVYQEVEASGGTVTPVVNYDPTLNKFVYSTSGGPGAAPTNQSQQAAAQGLPPMTPELREEQGYGEEADMEAIMRLGAEGAIAPPGDEGATNPYASDVQNPIQWLLRNLQGR